MLVGVPTRSKYPICTRNHLFRCTRLYAEARARIFRIELYVTTRHCYSRWNTEQTLRAHVENHKDSSRTRRILMMGDDTWYDCVAAAQECSSRGRQFPVWPGDAQHGCSGIGLGRFPAAVRALRRTVKSRRDSRRARMRHFLARQDRIPSEYPTTQFLQVPQKTEWFIHTHHARA